MTEEQAILDDVVGKSKPAEKKDEPQEAPQESQEEPKPAPEETEEAQPAEEPEAEEQQPAEGEKQETAEPAPEKEQQKPEEKKQKPVKEKIGENVVLVGKKPTMSYVLAAVTQFSDGLDEIHIKSRGRNISRAVDVAEVVRNRFVQGLTTDVTIGTQEIRDDQNNRLNVSTIDIALKK